MSTAPIILAVTGASGAPYALRLLERLLAAGKAVDLLISDAGRILLKEEADLELPDAAAEVLRVRFDPEGSLLRFYGKNDWYAPLASGSGGGRTMLVVPCTMGTLAAIAQGLSDNLIERAADVALKERGRLILAPRETPLSAIHLENMLKLARLGAEIVPLMPGFYQRPESVDDLVDFMVDRILAKLDINSPKKPPWGSGTI